MAPLTRRLLLGSLALLLIGGGQILRARSGLELHPEAIQAAVARQGWLAPAVFVVLVALRQFLLLPSGLLLAVGGLLFGPAAGSLLGATGLFASTVLLFGLARGFAGERARQRISRRFPTLDRSIEATGPLLVFLMMAYPLGVITPVSLAAGLSSVRLGPLLLAAALGAIIRSATFSFVGAALLDVGSPRFWLVMAIFLAVLFLPLAHPGLRRRLRGPRPPV